MSTQLYKMPLPKRGKKNVRNWKPNVVSANENSRPSDANNYNLKERESSKSQSVNEEALQAHHRRATQKLVETCVTKLKEVLMSQLEELM